MNLSDFIALISGAVGILISVITSFVPQVAEWFYSIPAKWRGLSMVGLNFVGALLVFGISCSGLFSFVACTQDSAINLLRAFFVMVATNQITYWVAPESPTKLAMKSKALSEALKGMATPPQG